MRNVKAPGGFTLVEVLIGLVVFLGVFIPLLRYAVIVTVATTQKDQKNAYALLRGECAVMYKNQQLPQSKRLVTIDNQVYEVSCTVEKSILAEWSMSVRRDGKSIASVQGFLYIPDEMKENRQ